MDVREKKLCIHKEWERIEKIMFLLTPVAMKNLHQKSIEWALRTDKFFIIL